MNKINIIHEKNSDLYKNLVGLSKEEIVKLLGEPSGIHKNSDINKEVYISYF